jgi:hypothetical protein
MAVPFAFAALAIGTSHRFYLFVLASTYACTLNAIQAIAWGFGAGNTSVWRGKEHRS